MAVEELADAGGVVEEEDAEEAEAALEGGVAVVGIDVCGEELICEGGEATEGD